MKQRYDSAGYSNPGGHDYVQWRDLLVEGVAALLGAGCVSVTAAASPVPCVPLP